MDFFSLFFVAVVPILQILLIGLLGTFLATDYISVLTPGALRDMNKVVFSAFTPSLLFSSLAEAITLQHVITWWYMPVNLIVASVVGGIVGWLIVKTLRPTRYLEGLIIACCCTGNWGNIFFVIMPAICNQKGSPFGSPNTCSTRGITYASLSAALGSFIVWTYGYILMQNAGILYQKMRRNNEIKDHIVVSNGEVLKSDMHDRHAYADEEGQTTTPLLVSEEHEKPGNPWRKINLVLHQIVHEIVTPPNAAAILGFIVGLIPWLKGLLIEHDAPLRVIEDSIKILGSGTVPCLILILGGNLTKGMRKSSLKPVILVAILISRYIILPLVGIGIIKSVKRLGFLPQDQLYEYVLVMQFVVPPAMNVGTMAQLFDVGQEECSVIFLWTYVAAAPMMTIWSMIYLWTST